MLPQIQTSPDNHTKFLYIKNNSSFKKKRSMLCFPMDFGKLTIEGVIDTRALSKFIPRNKFRASSLLVQQNIGETPSPFQLLLANGRLQNHLLEHSNCILNLVLPHSGADSFPRQKSRNLYFNFYFLKEEYDTRLVPEYFEAPVPFRRA